MHIYGRVVGFPNYSKFNNMNSNEPRLKNVISFGRQSTSSIQNSLSKQQISVRNEDSFSFDFNKQINNLGLDVVNASEKQLAQSIDLNHSRLIPAHKVCHFLMLVKESVLLLRDQVNAVRNDHLALGKLFYFGPICKQQRMGSYLYETTPTQSESLLISTQSLEKQKQKQKKKCSSFTINSAYSIKLRRELKFKRQSQLKQQTEADLLKQIERLQYENQLHKKEIQILRREIQSTQTICDKRQTLYNDKLKLKEIEWEKKINEVMRELNEAKNQEPEVKSWRTEDPKENQSDVSSYHLRNRCQTEISEDSIQHISYFNLKDSIRSKNTFDLTKTIKNSSPCKNELKQFLNVDYLNDKVQQRGKIFRSRERKQSTDYSYQRVKEKIKNFESSIKKQMHKIEDN